MGFGAFVGGFASGWQQGEKLQLQKEEMERKRQKEANDLAVKRAEELNKAEDDLATAKIKQSDLETSYAKNIQGAKTAEERSMLDNAYARQSQMYGNQVSVHQKRYDALKASQSDYSNLDKKTNDGFNLISKVKEGFDAVGEFLGLKDEDTMKGQVETATKTRTEIAAPAQTAGVAGVIAAAQRGAGKVESGNNYKAVGETGTYIGKYQFGFKTNEKDKDLRGDIVAKKLGYTKEEYMNNPSVQEEFMNEQLDYLKKGLDASGVQVTPYNLWLAHNQGIGGAHAITTGKLTKEVRNNMKVQGVDGKTDKELIENYNAKFQPYFDGTKKKETQPQDISQGAVNNNVTVKYKQGDVSGVLNINGKEYVGQAKTMDYLTELFKGGDAAIESIDIAENGVISTKDEMGNLTPLNLPPLQYYAAKTDDTIGKGLIKVTDVATGNVVDVPKADAVEGERTGKYKAYIANGNKVTQEEEYANLIEKQLLAQGMKPNEARMRAIKESKNLKVTKDNQTELESLANTIKQTPDFINQHGAKTEAEKDVIAFDMAYNKKNPKEARLNATSRFNVTNYNNDLNTIEKNYNNLEAEQQVMLASGQQEGVMWKTFQKDVSGKATGIKNLEIRANDVITAIDSGKIQFGLGIDQIDELLSSIPENWVSAQSDNQKKNLLTKITANTALQDLFFTYLNDVNKGAPSNADMAVMQKVVMGLLSGNNSTKKQAVTDFMRRVSGDIKRDYQTYAPSVYGAARREYEVLKTFKYAQPKIATETIGGVEYETKMIGNRKAIKNPKTGTWHYFK
jgi:hypothetical protein